MNKAVSAILQTENLAVTIGGKSVCAGLDMALTRGACLGILGMNGIGKTTLLLTLAGLRQADGGNLTIDGKRLEDWRGRELARVRGLMPQDTHDAFPLTVLEAALAGRHPYQSSWGWESRADMALAREALTRVDLAALEERDCATLSGGERRRLALATLLAQSPQLYLLDEPVNHLDPHHQILLLDLIAQECRERNRTAVMTLHEPNLAARYCSHVLLLYGNGEARYGTREALLTAENLSRLYCHRMLAHETAEGLCFLPA